MYILSDVITYVRRIIKSPSDAVISDNLIIDYINRFWMSDVDARIQVFDLKTTYRFQTTPGVDRYNMPLYSLQTEGAQTVAVCPVYQGFTGNATINGIPVSFSTDKGAFNSQWMNILQTAQSTVVGDGTAGPYTISMPATPNLSTVGLQPPYNAILRGHVDMAGIISTNVTQDPIISTSFATDILATSVSPAVYITSIGASGANVVVCDSGQMLTNNVNYGLLMTPGAPPYGNAALSGGYSTTKNTINYLTGVAKLTFPEVIPLGNVINAQCYFFATGLPRSILFYNNTLTLRAPPAQQYLVELDAYLSPAAFLSSAEALPFGYMAEYIARGAARKILSDTGDIEQFQFYEQFFREQELLVWKRSQRQWTATRTPTIYSSGGNLFGGYSFGGGL